MQKLYLIIWRNVNLGLIQEIQGFPSHLNGEKVSQFPLKTLKCEVENKVIQDLVRIKP